MVTLKVLKKFQDKDNKEKIYQVGELTEEQNKALSEILCKE